MQAGRKHSTVARLCILSEILRRTVCAKLVQTSQGLQCRARTGELRVCIHYDVRLVLNGGNENRDLKRELSCIFSYCK